jgi:HK97 family phage prohead protease
VKIQIRADCIEVEGYVNSVERLSKPLMSRMGQFIERICKGAFKRALKRNDNIRILLNHDWNRDLGGTKDGNLDLCEDAIGLRVRATITDKDVVDKAKRGDLVGWSFGFTDVDVDSHLENGVTVRNVKDLDLFEVSLLDRTKIPAYDGTLVTVRSDDERYLHGDALLDEIEVREIEEGTETTEETETEEPTEVPFSMESRDEEPKQHENVEKIIDYSRYENELKEMKEEYPDE